MSCKWLINTVRFRPQDLGLWDPFQIAVFWLINVGGICWLILQAPPALITWIVLKAAGEDRQPARTCRKNESGKCLVVSTQLKPITPKNINECHLKRDHVNRKHVFFQTSIFQRDVLVFEGASAKWKNIIPKRNRDTKFEKSLKPQPIIRSTLQGINISHLGEKENNLQNAIFGGYVSSLEGIPFKKEPSTWENWCFKDDVSSEFSLPRDGSFLGDLLVF